MFDTLQEILGNSIKQKGDIKNDTQTVEKNMLKPSSLLFT